MCIPKIKSNEDNPKQSCRTLTAIYEDLLLCVAVNETVWHWCKREKQTNVKMYTHSLLIYDKGATVIQSRGKKFFSVNVAGLTGVFTWKKRNLVSYLMPHTNVCFSWIMSLSKRLSNKSS